MRPRPMSFCGALVPHVLSGRKTRTMRVAPRMVAKPRYQVGDVIYISERVEFRKIAHMAVWDILHYLADETEEYVYQPNRVKTPGLGRWPGRVLPVEWARPWRGRITGVGITQVQDTTPSQVRREGLTLPTLRELWDKLNNRSGRRWKDDPWVWAYTWKPMETKETKP